jgi:hypothetical protein
MRVHPHLKGNCLASVLAGLLTSAFSTFARDAVVFEKSTIAQGSDSRFSVGGLSYLESRTVLALRLEIEILDEQAVKLTTRTSIRLFPYLNRELDLTIR